MALQPTPRDTVSEYLTMERAADERHEYLDGYVYAMAGESPAHGQICVNLGGLLWSHLRGGPCQMFTKDMKVYCPAPHRRSPLADLFGYPDLVVVCGTMQFHDEVQDVLLNPPLIIEVLSPSTEAFDRGSKFYRYSAGLPALTDYVLVAQEEPRIDHYSREAGGLWTLRMVAGLEEQLHVATLGWTVALVDVYERVVFPAAPPEPSANSC